MPGLCAAWYSSLVKLIFGGIVGSCIEVLLSSAKAKCPSDANGADGVESVRASLSVNFEFYITPNRVRSIIHCRLGFQFSVLP